MSVETVPAGVPAETEPPKAARPPRAWPPLALLGIYWGIAIGLRYVEVPFFFRFLYGMAAPALLLIAFSIWWWRNRAIPLGHRALGFIVVVGGALLAAPLSHPSIGLWTALMTGLPFAMTVWTLWIVAARKLALWRIGAIGLVLMLATWGSLALIRIEGVDGDLRPAMHWRWTPTAEEVFLADRVAAPSTGSPAPSAASSVEIAPGDWPVFRGPGRDAVVQSLSIATDWNARPPKLLWKQRIGPAWSSLIIVGKRLYTQEQRGEQELVVCYDAETGRELWAHADATRFWESVSGAGPRATPTFAEGRIYALGATGILNCLDAVTGKPHWSRNLQTDADAKIPMWGLSSSPLVAGGIVVVYGAGEDHDNLLAFDAETGNRAWSAAGGVNSYSSPELLTIAGRPQVVMFSDGGLLAVEPASGAKLWQAGVLTPGAPRSLQAHLVEGTRLLVGSLTAFGAALIDVAFSENENTWSAVTRWETTAVKPEFSDFVVHQGQAYGFDGAIFCCLDLETGQRRWKGGRYGRGQVLLLADQGLLLVLSETGQAILLTATPERHQELSRFQAVDGKCWNHPAIAHGRLYARNAEEIACYELPELAD